MAGGSLGQACQAVCRSAVSASDEVVHAEGGEGETNVRQSVNQSKAMQRKKRTEGAKKKKTQIKRGGECRMN